MEHEDQGLLARVSCWRWNGQVGEGRLVATREVHVCELCGKHITLGDRAHSAAVLSDGQGPKMLRLYSHLDCLDLVLEAKLEEWDQSEIAADLAREILEERGG